MENGWYICNVNTPTGAWWYVFTAANYSNAVIVQKAWYYNSGKVIECMRLGWLDVSVDRGGGWQPWEYVTPPMALNTEYRTTERYMGKPVYAKLVNCEALPNAGYKTVSVGVSGLEKVIDVSGCAIDAHNDDFYSIPATNFSSSVHNVGLYVTGSQAIAISTQSDRSSYNAYVKVKYTKTTD